MKKVCCQAALWVVVLAGCGQSGNAPVSGPAVTSDVAPKTVEVATSSSDNAASTDVVLVTLKLPGMT